VGDIGLVSETVATSVAEGEDCLSGGQWFLPLADVALV